jgi:rubrerythrin
MDTRQGVWTCTECGFTSSERFPKDICPRCSLTYWKCDECSYTFAAGAAPDVCPECGRQCRFLNITCYIPDWDNTELTIGYGRSGFQREGR